ncbi:MAG TPA: PAS domain S-box protein [Bacteroidales bacterium]|nr:PAS domain S-box protein [Bacteroidales bacterium]
MDKLPTYEELLQIIKNLENNLASAGLEVDGKDNIKELSGNLQHRIQKDQWLSWIINHGSEVHYIHDTNHELTFISPQCEALFGYTVEEMHRDWRTLITGHPINKEGRRKTQQAIDTGEKQEAYLLEAVRKDKTKIWIEIEETPVIGKDNKVIGIVGVIRDVSERILVEEALKESERRYRSLVTNMAELITEIDSAGNYTYVNDQYIDILGYHPGELLGHPVQDFIHPDDLGPSAVKFEALKANQAKSVDIWRFRHKNGTFRTFECRSSFFKHHSGELRAIVIAYDITERIARELENDMISQRLTRAEEVARLGHWELDLNAKTMIGSPGASQIYGVKTGKLNQKNIQEIPLKQYRNVLDRALVDLIQNGKPYDLEFKIKRKSDGKIIDVHSIAEYNKQCNLVFGIIQDITAQKNAEREVRESGERFRTVIEENPIPIVLAGKNRTITALNRNFVKTYGYSADDVKNTDNWWNLACPGGNDRKEILEKWNKSVNRAMTNAADVEKHVWEVRCKDGTIKTAEFHFVSLSDVNVISVIDITGIIEAKKALEESEEKLRLAIQASGYSLYEINMVTGETIFSPEFSAMLGYSDPDLFKSVWETSTMDVMIHPDDKDRVTILMDKYLAGEINEYYDELRFAKSGGGWIWVMSSGKIVSYGPDGKPQRMLGILADITQIKDYEMLLLNQNQEIATQNEEYAALNEELQSALEELKQTNAYLEEEKERAMESDRLKSAFLANMSHEIRTPMNSILGFSELLSQEGLEMSKRQKYSSLISSSGEQLMMLINDIIDISKIESNQLRIEKEWCRINELLEEILINHRQHRKFLEKKSLLLRFRPPVYERELSLYTDCHRMKQIFDNLINNAVKFTDEGYIEIGYRLVTVKNRRLVEFYVKDTGSGIPRDSLEKIFIRFMQAENASHSGGTGLGLSITKGLVDLLGGSITVESDPGKGSTFKFTHPLKAE